ncbi:MAG: stage II sporulation protein R [Gemmiger sp.]
MNRHRRTVMELGFGLGLFFAILLTFAAAGRETVRAAVCADTVRLHILANSDSVEDQLCKLRVRDAVLGTVSAALAEASDQQTAVAALRGILPVLERTAALAAGGQPVRVRLAEEDFEARDYGDFALPGGRYTALRIELGGAAGHNWFCVLYPSLCVPGAAASYDAPAQNALVFGRYTLRSALWDALHGVTL